MVCAWFQCFFLFSLDEIGVTRCYTKFIPIILLWCVCVCVSVEKFAAQQNSAVNEKREKREKNREKNDRKKNKNICWYKQKATLKQIKNECIYIYIFL